MTKNTTDELEGYWHKAKCPRADHDYSIICDCHVEIRALISNREKLARIDELESFTGHSNEIPDSEVRARIATLRKELDGGQK